MASNTTYKVYRIDNGAAVKSVKELKQYIKDLQDSLLKAGTNEEELTKTTEALAKAQETLASAMKAGTKDVNAASDSIVGMRKQYKELYDQYKLLSKAQRESPLGQQMQADLKTLSDTINSTNQSVGSYKDNIGNYAGSIKEAFSSLPNIFGNLNKGISSTAGMFKKLYAAMGPIGLLLAAIAGAVKLLSDGIKNNNQASDKMAVVMAKLKAPLQVVENAFKKIAVAVVDFVDKAVGAVETVIRGYTKLQRFFAKFFDTIGLDILADGINNAMDGIEKGLDKTKEMSKELADIAQKQNDLNQLRRDNTEGIAKMEAEIAKQREIAGDKENYTTKERLEAINEAKKISEDMYNARMNEATMELEILTAQIEAEGGLEVASEERLNQLSELNANISTLTAQFYSDMRNLNKQSNSITKEAAADAKQAAKDAREAVLNLLKLRRENAVKGSQIELDAYKAVLEAEKNEDIREAKEKIKDRTVLAATIAEIEKKYARDVVDAEKEYRESVLERANQEATIQNQGNEIAILEAQIKNYMDFRATIRKEDYEDELAYNNAIYTADLELFNKQMELIKEKLSKQNIQVDNDYLETIIGGGYANALENEYKKQENIVKSYEEQMAEEIKMYGKVNEETKNAYLQSKKELIDTEDKLNEEALAKTKEKMLQDTMFLSESSIQRLTAVRDAALYEYKNLQQRIGESDDDFKQRQLEAKKAWVDADKALDDQYLSNWQDLASAVASVMSSFSDMYEEEINVRLKSGKISQQQAEKEFESIKKMRVAESVISTINGMIDAYMGAQSLGVPWGQIIGAANAAAVGAAGWANIRKIQSTTLSNASSASNSIATPVRYSAEYTNSYSSQSTGQNELYALNQTVNGISSQIDNIKLYVLENDITTTQNMVKARLAESTF